VTRCKAGKIKCSDYRPCKPCKHSIKAGTCVDEESSIHRQRDALSNGVSIHANVCGFRVQTASLVAPTRASPVLLSPPIPIFGNEFPEPNFASRQTTYVSAQRSIREFPVAMYTARDRIESSSESHETSCSNAHLFRSLMPRLTSMHASIVQVPLRSTYSSPRSSGTADSLQPRQFDHEPNRLQTQQYIRSLCCGMSFARTLLPTASLTVFSNFRPTFLLNNPLMLTEPQTFTSPVAATTVPVLTAPSIDASLLHALRGRLEASPCPHGLVPISSCGLVLSRVTKDYGYRFRPSRRVCQDTREVVKRSLTTIGSRDG
jgi:hypothetical protein